MPLALVAADALEHAADRIARRCAAVRGVDDRKRLHEARLALKSARYLLSPLAASADDGAVMLRAIKEGQSQLGEMLDAHGLRDRVRRTREAIDMTATGAQKQSISALAATERDLTHRVDAAYAQCAAWLQHDTRDALLARLRAIATAWRAAAAPPMEIERKWLLSALPPRLHELMPAALRQGYLPGDTLIERIRSVVRDGETHWFRTVKLGRGMARIEIEEETSAPLGETLFALTEGSRVEKRRYSVQDGMHTWEIDDFTDRALVLAEVELEREDDVVELPVWLAPYVVREVTGEKAFTNWKLAR
jgi:CYTH domain-containing protein